MSELKDAVNAVFLLESQGVNLYENLKQKDEIFAQILEVKKSGLELLKSYEPSGDLPSFFASEQENLDACLVRALNYEFELNKFYENLTDDIEDEAFKDVCFRLWATSNNEYIPALKEKLALNLTTPQVAQTNENILSAFDVSNFNQISQILERLGSGKGEKEDIKTLLNNPNFSFFGGLALGGLASMLINKKDNKE